MLATPTLDKLHALKLPAMAQAWTEQQKNAELAALSFDERLGLLIDAEWLARENKRLARALQEYGFNLGITFQIVDDMLDFTGDLKAVGKPIGADLREGKMTLPLIHLLRSGDEVGTKIVRDIIEEAQQVIESRFLEPSREKQPSA